MIDAAVVAPVAPTPKAKEKLPRGIRRRGNRLYAYLTHPDGRPELRALGNGATVAFAKDQRVVWQREILANKYIKPVPRTEPLLFRTIADAAIEYARQYKRCWGTDEQRIGLFKEWWGNRPANTITTEEIHTKLSKAKSQGFGREGVPSTKATFNEYRSLLFSVFNHAIESEEDKPQPAILKNPVKKVRRYKNLDNSRTRELTAEEETRLRLAIREMYPQKEVELDLLLHTGARCSNWYGIHRKGRAPMEPLQWCNVNLDWKLVTFPRSKAGVGYRVPLNQTAVDALKVLLKRAPDGTGPVIRKPSGLELKSCRKWFENCCEKARILDLHLHDLRHTFATRLRRNKVPFVDVVALLGHDLKKNSVTARYAHPDLDVLRQAVDTLVPVAIVVPTQKPAHPLVEFPKAEAV